jgi:serine/threonine protein kinase
MAPEYIHEGTITPKSDIFSLGVIIMELIMGHRDYPGVAGTSSESFIEFVWEFCSSSRDRFLFSSPCYVLSLQSDILDLSF